MSETFNQLATPSLWVGTVALAVVSIGVTRRLVEDAVARGCHPGGAPLGWDVHLLAYFFIFSPVVLWPLIVAPVTAVIPAALASAIAFDAYRHVATQDKLKAFVVVLSSTGMWLCYGVYEDLVTLSGKERADLVIVAPLLYYSSLMLWRFARSAKHEHRMRSASRTASQ